MKKCDFCNQYNPMRRKCSTDLGFGPNMYYCDEAIKKMEKYLRNSNRPRNYNNYGHGNKKTKRY